MSSSVKRFPYPRVWRSTSLQAVAIVYSDRVEYYFTQGAHGRQINRGYDGEKYSSIRAEEVLTNEGFKRVHYQERPAEKVDELLDGLRGTQIDEGKEE